MQSKIMRVTTFHTVGDRKTSGSRTVPAKSLVCLIVAFPSPKLSG